MKKTKATEKSIKIMHILFLCLIALLNVYIFINIRNFCNLVLNVESGYIIGIIITFLYIIINLCSKVKNPAINKMIYMQSGIYYTILTYLVLFSCIANIVFFAIKNCISPSVNELNHITIILGYIVILLTTLVCLYGFFNTKKIKTKKYTIKVPKSSLKEGYKIALISDLHIGYFVKPNHLKKIANLINSLNANIVLIAGDLFNNGNVSECEELKASSKIFQEIQSKEGVFATLGNHDPSIDNKNLHEFIKSSNITLLYDEVYSNENFNIIGRADIYNNKNIRKPLSELIKNKSCSNKINIVVDHNPLGIDEAVENNVQCVLCGHTHRGQIFPLNIIVKLVHGKTHFFGKYKENNTNIIITSGAGFFGLPFRLGTNNEIVLIEFCN